MITLEAGHLRRRKLKDRIFTAVCFLATAIGAILLVTLIGSIVQDGLGRLSLDFIRNAPSVIKPETAGIWPALVGSIYVMVLTAAIAVPVGLAAAIYLEEFTTRRNGFTNFIQANIANLAGVPSIVYGMLGLAVFVKFLALEESILAGALTMSLLILPMVILVSQEALKAVPKSYREGSLALGATQWQTIRGQVLPSALPGVLTGIILSMSRAIGETAPLIVVGAVGMVTFTPNGLDSRYTVLPLQIFQWAGEPREVFHVAAAAAIIVLITVLLLMNGFAIWLRNRTQKRV